MRMHKNKSKAILFHSLLPSSIYIPNAWGVRFIERGADLCTVIALSAVETDHSNSQRCGTTSFTWHGNKLTLSPLQRRELCFVQVASFSPLLTQLVGPLPSHTMHIFPPSLLRTLLFRSKHVHATASTTDWLPQIGMRTQLDLDYIFKLNPHTHGTSQSVIGFYEPQGSDSNKRSLRVVPFKHESNNRMLNGDQELNPLPLTRRKEISGTVANPGQSCYPQCLSSQSFVGHRKQHPISPVSYIDSSSTLLGVVCSAYKAALSTNGRVLILPTHRPGFDATFLSTLCVTQAHRAES